MEETFFTVSTFKGASDSFVKLLDENKITYKVRAPSEGIQMNATETLEIIGKLSGASPLLAFAWIVVEWIKAKHSRKVQIQTKGDEIIHITAEGYTAKEVSTILASAKRVTVFDPEHNR